MELEISISKFNIRIMDLSKDEIIRFLKGQDKDILFKNASDLREKFFKDEVLLRAIIEFSNYCIRDCLYCGLRRENNRLNRYRIELDKILNIAQEVIDKGIETIVLQSGDDFYYSRDMMVDIIKAIKSLSSSIAVTLSIGERPLNDYRAFYDAGADRYLMKHETANENLYNSLHPNQSFKDRLNILYFLKKIGYQIGLGHIVGLPNQSLGDLAGDILLYQEFQPDMLGLGPFIPATDTPLYSKSFSVDMNLVLRSYALARIVTKNAHIPLTTASFTLGNRDIIEKALKVSANVIMVDVTSKDYSIDYKIYDDRYSSSIEETDKLIKETGLTPSYFRGDSLKNI